MRRKIEKQEEKTYPGERIAKVMSRAGLGSRRALEEAIMDGRVAVNGETIESPAFNVTTRDKITLDGKAMPKAERTRLWLYHKEKGLVTTASDPEGRPTVFDTLPDHLPRVISVGRLDINTEGLLLLTNDGGLKRLLELPTTGWLRRYRVRAYGAVDGQSLQALQEGVTIEGIHYGPIEARVERVQGGNTWLEMGIREGKNREIKHIAEYLGLKVNRLIRVSFGPFQLRDLKEGEVREIPPRMLKDQLGERLMAEAETDLDSELRSQDIEIIEVKKTYMSGDDDENKATSKASYFAKMQEEGEDFKPRRRVVHDAETKQMQLEPKRVKDRKGRDIPVADKAKQRPKGAPYAFRTKLQKRDEDLSEGAYLKRPSDKRSERAERFKGYEEERGERKRSFSREDGERKSFGEKRPYRERSFSREDGTRKSFGEKRPYRERGEGERKPFGEKRPYRERSSSGEDETRKSFGEKRPYREKRDDRDGFKPRSKRPFSREDGERKPFGEKRPYREKRDDRDGFKPRSKGPYSRDDGERKSFGEKRPYREKRDDRDGFKPRSKRPFSREDGERKPFGEKRPYREKRGDGERGERKSFGKKDFGARKPRDGKPRDGKPRDEKPRGEKPFGRKPSGKGGFKPRGRG